MFWKPIESGDTLEEKLQKIEENIENYQPDTQWDATDNRVLKYLKQNRNKLIKAIERKKEKEKKMSKRLKP